MLKKINRTPVKLPSINSIARLLSNVAYALIWSRVYIIFLVLNPEQLLHSYVYNLINSIYLFKIINSIKLRRFTKLRFYVLRKHLNFSRRRQKRTYAIRTKLRKAGRSLRLFTWWKRRRLKKNYKLSFIKFFLINKTQTSISTSKAVQNNTPSLIQRVLPSAKLNKNYLKYAYFYSATAGKKKFYNLFNSFKFGLNPSKSLNLTLLWKLNTTKLTSRNRISYLFVDANKSPLMLMKNSRDVYVALTIRKTTRNLRYKVFLKKELKFLKTTFLGNYRLAILVRIYGFAFTWYQSYLLVKYSIVWVNGVQQSKNTYLVLGDIFQFVNCKGLFLFITYTLKKYTRIKKKIKRAGYLRFMSYKKRWVTRKKNGTRFLEWFSSAAIATNSSLVYDYFSCSGCILKKTHHYAITTDRTLLTSTVLKMSAWKFRAR